MSTFQALARTPFNMSIDADQQQQEAASPQVLMVRSFLRWTSKESL